MAEAVAMAAVAATLPKGDEATLLMEEITEARVYAGMHQATGQLAKSAGRLVIQHTSATIVSMQATREKSHAKQITSTPAIRPLILHGTWIQEPRTISLAT